MPDFRTKLPCDKSKNLLRMIYAVCISSPIGPLTVVANETAVTAIHFGDSFGEASERSVSDVGAVSSPRVLSTDSDVQPDVLRQAVRELTEFFAGRLRTFSVPLAPEGTPFQQEVWTALQTIPYGATCSYRDIACAVGRPAACRAVGMANHCNPIPIIIPCHRVVGANGRLTGYGGGLEIKAGLLRLERENSAGRSLFP